MIMKALERGASTLLICFVFFMGFWTMMSSGVKVLLGFGLILVLALWVAKLQARNGLPGWAGAPAKRSRPYTDVPRAEPFPYGVTYVWWSPEGQPYVGKTLLHRLDERDAEHYASGRLPLSPGWSCDKKIWADEREALRMEQEIYDDLVNQGFTPLNRMRPAGV